MEICFENKVVGTYREIYHQIKRIQESAETVVPDTNEDIGKIASVQTTVLLKSKDVTGRGVSVTGETSAVLLYITENEDSVSYVTVTKSFAIEYDIADISPEAAAQIKLSVTNTEARIINPRKVAVTIEIAGELSCYRQETLNVETALPDTPIEGLHARFETAEAVLINAVCEKTFAFNEQFAIQQSRPMPSKLVYQKVEFSVGETQHVGSKVILKGNVNLAVCCMSEDLNYPSRLEFSAPFSQIIDTGEDEMDSCTAIIEPTSLYFELVDTISGEKAIDAELHAVVQIVSRRKRAVSYISDMYSNLMPVRCGIESAQLSADSGLLRTKLSADERLNIAEDCAEILGVFPSLSQCSIQDGKIGVSVCLDIIYSSSAGALSSAKRIISMEGECLENQARLIGGRLSDVYLRPDSGTIDSHVTVEIGYLSCAGAVLERVMSIELDEEAAFELENFPTVSLVRREKETLWELAKQYRSSISAILEMNENAEDARLLLIPKEI